MAEECTVVRFSGGPSSVQIDDLKSDGGCKVPEGGGHTFGPYYIVCVVLSILTYVLDLGLAVALLYYYSANGLGSYFAVTLTFLLVPALFMTAFNLRWYIVDHDDPTIDTLYYGIKSVIWKYGGSDHKQTTYYRRMLDEDTNGALLRLFHCFLHAGPQCVIQLMILLREITSEENLLVNREFSDLAVIQAWTIIVGLISIAWSLTSYHRSVRYARDDKEKMSWKSTTIAFCWQLMSTVSRVVALSLLAVIYPSWMGIVCVLHWAVMALWLAFEHLTASCDNKCDELMLSVALGLAYVLAFISPRDGPTRYVYLAYYLVCFMENTGALVVWCVTNNSMDNPVLYYGAVLTQIVSFLLAITFLLVYYRYCHPSMAERDSIFAKPGKSGLCKSYNPRSYS